MIATERLVLRRFRRSDVPSLQAYRSDEAVARYQTWTAPVSLAETRRLVKKLAAADPATPGWFEYALERTADGALIGDVGVNLHENRMQAEIGFTLASAAQGHGYMTEAIRALLDHLFRVRGLLRVSAACDERNVASARLLERVGFTREGRRPAYTFNKGEWADDLLYGLLARDWNRSPTGSAG